MKREEPTQHGAWGGIAAGAAVGAGAEKSTEKEMDVDRKEFKRELDQAEKEYATA